MRKFFIGRVSGGYHRSMYDLNDEQWAVVTCPSPVLIHAAAGSGKTRCLTSKIRHLIDTEAATPQSILAITFTNKAAKEMRERLKAHCPAVAEMQISTIHSMCVRIIRTFIRHTPLKNPFSIFDDSDQMAVIKTVMKARKMDGDPWEALAAISRAKGEQVTDALKDDLKEVYEAYQAILLKNNACDFDDLLTYALACVEHEDCRKHYTGIWRHILVDEFQDTSTVHYNIVTSLYDPSVTKTMFVVGDENQSIYGWRQARPENVQKFIDTYKANVRNLTYNYRSASGIIGFANGFLQFGEAMVAKSVTTGSVSVSQFYSHEDEAAQIADILSRSANLEQVAILYRVNARSLMFERAFAARRIPYKVVGDIPFYRRKVVKDLLAYCKAAANPADLQSLCRAVNVPKRGFGEVRQERLMREGRGFLESEAEKDLKLKHFLDTLDTIRGRRPADAIQAVVDKTGYGSTLEKESDLSMLETFLEIASSFPTVEELVLASTFLEEDSGKGVRLMTVHAAKGLEFDSVFVVGVEEGLWPHKMSTDDAEERRLYFVAVSRAKLYLNVSYSKSRLLRGQPIVVQPSPLFIDSVKMLQHQHIFCQQP